MQPSIEAQGILTLLIILSALLGTLALFLLLGFRKTVLHGNTSPYSGAVMQFGQDLAQSLQRHINEFLREFSSLENPEIDFTQAAICPITGRVFSNCVVKGKKISLDWTFLKKRFPGQYVSWGALPEDEKGMLRILHVSLDGFQTEQSSCNVRPEKIEREFALLSPGPLYIDRLTKVAMGWQRVPGTSFEVLIVQKPLYHSFDETL